MGSFTNWDEYRDSLVQRVWELSRLQPELLKGLTSIERGAAQSGRLDPKVHELIALAVAVTTRCDGCIAIHAKKAVALGVEKEEIAEALSIAVALNAGAALSYSARVMDAFDAPAAG